MFYTIIILYISLCIGSFLNVVIWRLPKEDLSIIKPLRSFCPKCKKQLSALENIPVFSWLFQGGKCKHCAEKISIRYPIVEILSAVLCYLSIEKYGLTLNGLFIYLFCCVLIVITFIDLDLKIIPDKINLPGMIIGLSLGLATEFYDFTAYPWTSGVRDSLFGWFVGAGFLYAVIDIYYRLTGEIGMGGGDVKMMGMVGALFGWQAIFPAIFMGSILGSIVGLLVVIISPDKSLKYELPFGPWLALGVLYYILTDFMLFRFPSF